MAPDAEKLREFFAKHNVVLVHFSTPQGGNPERQYPKDLSHAITKCVFPLSCSTVGPLDNEGNTLSGEVGVILLPDGDNSLLGVGPRDLPCSSFNGFAEVPEKFADVSLEACARSIAERGKRDHNEWVVTTYRVAGLFALGDTISWDSPMFRATRLRDDFPGRRVYSHVEGEFVELVDGVFVRTTVSNIYSEVSALKIACTAVRPPEETLDKKK